MVLIRSNTVFVYSLVLQITGAGNAVREVIEETNVLLLYDSEEEFQEIEIVKYNLEKRVGLQVFQEQVDNNARDELDRCLQKN